jgi:hypothetical protein
MRKRTITINDKMQKNYSYALTAPIGRNFSPEFKPACRRKINGRSNGGMLSAVISRNFTNIVIRATSLAGHASGRRYSNGPMIVEKFN